MTDKIVCKKCGGTKKPYTKRCLYCMTCYVEKYGKTFKGRAYAIYRNFSTPYRDNSMVVTDRICGMKEFVDSLCKNPDYIKAWEAWKESGFGKKLRPSVRRIVPELGYEPYNLEIYTGELWGSIK